MFLKHMYQEDSHDDGIGAEPWNGVRGLLLDGGRDEDAVHDDLQDEDDDDGHVEIGEGSGVTPAALDGRRCGVPLKKFNFKRVASFPVFHQPLTS